MKRGLFWILFFSTIVTLLLVYLGRHLDYPAFQAFLQAQGFLAPVIYMVAYGLGTILLVPSTPLNLMGGVLFGPLWGTLWTSLAAIVAAIVTFLITRHLAQDWARQKLGSTWQHLDQELQRGGWPYLFALRLLPLWPYGLVNLGAGLTSIRTRDYSLGTVLGTVPGLFPFVYLGSQGMTALETGAIVPLVAPLVLIGLLVGGATWYQRQQAP